jgi:hypothetical protein
VYYYISASDGVNINNTQKYEIDVRTDVHKAIIKGNVTDGTTFQPIPYANVTAYKGSTLVKLVTTDTAGKYKMTLLTGIYTLKCTKSGYNPSSDIPINLTENLTIDFMLYPEGTDVGSIAGTVFCKGIGLRDATVTLYTNKTLVDIKKTDDKGFYRFTNLKPGEYVLTVSKKGYSTVQKIVYVEPGRETIANFVLNIIPGKIKGKVVDEFEKPTSAEINLIELNLTASANETGEFVITVEPGEYTILITKQGYRNWSTSVSVEANQTLDLGVIKLERAEEPPTEKYPIIIIVSVVIVLILILVIIIKKSKPRKRKSREPRRKTKIFTIDRIRPTITCTSDGTAVNIKWATAPSDCGYAIYHSRDGINFERLVHLRSGINRYTHKGLKVGEKHFYRVVTYDSLMNEIPISDPMAIICRKTKKLPLRARLLHENTIELSWDTVPTDKSYIIYHSTDNIHFEKLAELSAGTSTYIHKVDDGKKHYYKISIIDVNDVESPKSVAVECDTRCRE